MLSSLKNAALLMVDLQKDFCEENGAYARNGIPISEIRKIIPPLREVVKACKREKIPVIASQYLILTDLEGQPLLSSQILKARPFLAKEGFRLGSPGFEIIEELPPPDYKIEKVAFSAFYNTRLEFLLRKLNITSLLIAGVGTNGAVESTVRDAHLRDYTIYLLEDCVAGFNPALHEASLKNMATLGQVINSSVVLSS
jgi:nicotinamidase-related amidase